MTTLLALTVGSFLALSYWVLVTVIDKVAPMEPKEE